MSQPGFVRLSEESCSPTIDEDCVEIEDFPSSSRNGGGGEPPGSSLHSHDFSVWTSHRSPPLKSFFFFFLFLKPVHHSSGGALLIHIWETAAPTAATIPFSSPPSSPPLCPSRLALCQQQRVSTCDCAAAHVTHGLTYTLEGDAVAHALSQPVTGIFLSSTVVIFLIFILSCLLSCVML